MVCIRPSNMSLLSSANVVCRSSNPNHEPEESKNNLVLCGKRGKANSKNPGNIKFTKIVRASVNDYIKAHDRTNKALFVASVVSYLVHDVGLKFMHYDKSSGQFKDLSIERVHDKVSHAIRDQIRQNGKEQQEQRRLLSSSSSSSSSSKAAPASRKRRPTAIKKKADVERNPPQVPDVTKPASTEASNPFCLSSSAAEHHPMTTATPSLFLNELLFDIGSKVEETFDGGSNNSNEVLSVLEDVLYDYGDDDMILFKTSVWDSEDSASSSSNNTPSPDACSSSLSNMMRATTPSAVSSSSGHQHLPLPFDTETEFESQDIEFLKVVLSTSENTK